MTATQDKTRAAFIAAPTPAAAARIVGRNGKGFRDVLRSVFGVYVSRDGSDAWAKVAPYAYAYLSADGTKRKAIADAFKNGKPLPS